MRGKNDFLRACIAYAHATIQKKKTVLVFFLKLRGGL